jgi:hypothetical protein
MGKVQVVESRVVKIFIEGEIEDRVEIHYPRRKIVVELVEWGDFFDIVLRDSETGEVLFKKTF